MPKVYNGDGRPRTFVRGAGEPRGPAPVVSDSVFKPFGTHLIRNCQGYGSRLCLKETRDRSPAIAGRRDAQSGRGLAHQGAREAAAGAGPHLFKVVKKLT